MTGKAQTTNGADPMIEVVGLKKSFGALHVLKDINLSVPRGHVVAMIGPSGSGKSTLLRSLNLLSLPDAGCITIGGHRMDFSAGRVSMRDRDLAAFRGQHGVHAAQLAAFHCVVQRRHSLHEHGLVQAVAAGAGEPV